MHMHHADLADMTSRSTMRRRPGLAWAAVQRGPRWLMTALLLIAPTAAPVAAQDVARLKNGLQLEGDFLPIGGICDAKASAAPQSVNDLPQLLVTMVDDGLRRTFFHQNNLATQPRPAIVRPERIRLEQDVQKSGRQIASIGSMIPGPFDERGRRVVRMRDGDGTFYVLQGVSELNPTCVVLEGLAGRQPYEWRMSVATSSVPADLLSRIVANHLDQQNIDDRMRMVRLYTQADRYKDARDELARMLEDFPDVAQLKDQLDALQQQWAKQIVRDIRVLSQEAGRHQLAYQMLKTFPAEGVATETLLEVRELLRDYDRQLDQQAQVKQHLAADIASLPNDARRQRAELVLSELELELNIETLRRVNDYLRLMNDAAITPDRKVALAVGGWILGPGAGVQNLDLAAAYVRLRELVAEYLEGETLQQRNQVLEQIQLLEGASPEVVARLLANMKPVLGSEGAVELSPLRYRISTPVEGLLQQKEASYLIQLPDQYEPYRRYPCVVSLCGATNTPESQLNWWSGGVGYHRDHPARRGYIVIAPEWTKEKQGRFEYSAREHASVLASLRDACRRYSIDTDRVFLSGHFMGGDAAWDIGLAHPDLWAGVIPIGASADKYVTRYWQNAAGLPWYFVGGDLDVGRLQANCSLWDRSLKSGRFDTVVVLYQGRGEEDYNDELPRLMGWMSQQRRTLARAKFRCDALRPWDNFFWWVEVDDYPPRSRVPPLAWPMDKSREATTEGEVLPENANAVRVTTDANEATVFLLPDLLRLDEEATVFLNGKKITAPPPSVEVILEDARTRCDRQHPFWTKVEARANIR